MIVTGRQVSAEEGQLVESVLRRHVETFLQVLAAVHYSECTRSKKRRTIEAFLHWTRTARLTVDEVDEALVDRYLERVLGQRYKRGTSDRGTLHQFIEHLRGVGALPPRRERASSPAEILASHYVEYLRRERGLSEHSVAVYAPFVREFVVAQGLAEGQVCLDAAAIRGHLLSRSQGRSFEYTRLLATSLRSFLRFLFLRGESGVDLSMAVPPTRRWQCRALPALLSADEVQQVLGAIDRTTASGRRTLAMLLLLARLGLRPGEVAGLELDDIDWTLGEITVRGKGRFVDRMPLPVDVGEALALYLRNDRGQGPSRRVFLRLNAPRVGLTGPCAVCAVARNAIHRAGLHPHGRVGAHLFRRSLATEMIRRGASLAEISQVLRHRRPETTEVYAKVDFEALRRVARRWPALTGGG